MASIATTCKELGICHGNTMGLWGKQAMTMDYDLGFNGRSMMSSILT
jgi:hypothetical protein